MVSLEDIPAEVRWEIAAKTASATPLAYDMVFREVLGDRYDEIERPIYIEAGKEMKGLAAALGLPTDNAMDLDDAAGVLTTILYGPEFEFGNVEGTEDRAVSRVTGCAVLNRTNEMGLDPKVVCLGACRTFCKSTIENLNRSTPRGSPVLCAPAILTARRSSSLRDELRYGDAIGENRPQGGIIFPSSSRFGADGTGIF